jgi:hypothetical protein
MKLTQKISTIAAGCLLLASGSSFAQNGLDFGIKGIFQATALLNNTDQAAGPELDLKNKLGGGGGASVGYTFNKHMGVELGVLYSKQGWSYTGSVGRIGASNDVYILCTEFQGLAQSNNIPFTGTYSADISLTCIKIPLLFRYTGDNTKSTYFSSFIGPQINMLSAVNVQVNNTNASFSGYGIKAEDLYKKMTIDAVLGLGVGIKLSTNFLLTAHLRLDYGLGDAEDKSKTITVNGALQKFWDSGRAATNNATGGLLVGLNYKLVKKAKSKK